MSPTPCPKNRPECPFPAIPDLWDFVAVCPLPPQTPAREAGSPMCYLLPSRPPCKFWELMTPFDGLWGLWLSVQGSAFCLGFLRPTLDLPVLSRCLFQRQLPGQLVLAQRIPATAFRPQRLPAGFHLRGLEQQ